MQDHDTTPNSWLIGYGTWIFKTRNWVFPLFMFALFAGFPPIAFAAAPSADIWLDATGVALALAGSLYRAWVIGLAYIKRGGVDRKVYADTLVTTGMFGVCRNPLYVGNALVLVGLFLIHNNPLLYLVGALVFGVSYWAIVSTEEYYLRQKFGLEYTEYCARVNRFLPNFSRYAQSAQGHRFSWRRAVTKDHGSVVIWMLAAIALYVYEQATWSPIDIDAREVSFAVAASLVVLATWGLIRILKKSGALDEIDDADATQEHPRGLMDFRPEAPFLLLVPPFLVLMAFSARAMAFWHMELSEDMLQLAALFVCLIGIGIRMWAPNPGTGDQTATSDAGSGRRAGTMAHLGDVAILAGVVIWMQAWLLLPLLCIAAFIMRPQIVGAVAATDGRRPAPQGARLRVGAIRLAELVLALVVIECLEDLIIENGQLTFWLAEDLPWLLLFAAGLLVAASMWKIQKRLFKSATPQ